MKTCPRCKRGTVTLQPVLMAKTLPTYSVAGTQTKVVAEQLAIVSCSACDLNVKGKLENATVGPDGVFTGGHFVEVRDV